MSKKSVLFICLGNICRSPIAEAVFIDLLKQRGLTNQWIVDSAATADYHVGKGPDKRAIATLNNHGNNNYVHRVRQITDEDFSKFDYIFGMDDMNISYVAKTGIESSETKGLKSDLNRVARQAKGSKKAKIELLGKYDPEGIIEIPDPYYDGTAMFEQVYQQCLRSCTGFLDSFSN